MKKFRSFTAGVVATLMAVSTVGTALAASSRAEYNKAGISLFGEDKVLTGESYKAPNGRMFPLSLHTSMRPAAKPTISPFARSLSCWASKSAGTDRRIGSTWVQTLRIMWW